MAATADSAWVTERRVPADPTLSGLDEVVAGPGAPDFVAEAAARLVGVDLAPESSDIEHTSYRPGVEFVALWSFEASAGQRVFVSGRLLPNENGATLAADTSFRRLAAEIRRSHGIRGPGFTYLRGRQLLLQAFPLDHAMPGLALAASPAWVGDLLERTGGVGTHHVSAAELVSYKPGRRCLIRYMTHSAQESSPSHLFGRAFRDDRGRSIFVRAGALDRELRSAALPWETPKPLLFSDEADLVLLGECAAGVELKDLLRKAAKRTDARDRLLPSLARIGADLVRFHSLPSEGLPKMTPRRLVAAASDKAERIRSVDVALADACRRRFGNLDEWAHLLPPERQGLTHSSFRPSHLVLQGDDVTLMDTDNLCRSGGSFDPGSFVAYLDRAQHVKSKLGSTAEAARDAFLEGVAEHRRVDGRWLNWYRAYAHVKSAVGTFLSLDADWPDQAAALLRLADLLAQSQAVDVEVSQ